jgi:protein arginine kinase activator
MNCDHCDKPAVVHELVIKNGSTVEVHLCEEHAAEYGHQVPSAQPSAQLLTQFAVIGPLGSGAKGGKQQAKVVKACPNCSSTLAHIRQSGVLGCPDCYHTFEAELTALIEQAQAGANFHCGRSPRNCRDISARLELRSRLAKELDEAVAAEQYERAATLRDRLLHLSTHASDSDEAGGQSGQPSDASKTT